MLAGNAYLRREAQKVKRNFADKTFSDHMAVLRAFQVSDVTKTYKCYAMYVAYKRGYFVVFRRGKRRRTRVTRRVSVRRISSQLRPWNLS